MCNTMIDTLSKGLNQKPVMIKRLPGVTPSRAFALWLALLCLYFLLLPTAATTPARGVEMSASADQRWSRTVSVGSRYRHHAPVPPPVAIR